MVSTTLSEGDELMTAKTLSHSVRYAFASLALALTAYTVLESAVGRPAVADAAVTEGTVMCGSRENPCQLEPVAVQVRAVDTQLSQAECGSKEQPCRMDAITVEAQRTDTRLVSARTAPRMTLRARS